MGRNKDIKLLHDITGNPYRVCRAKLKENKWDLLEAFDDGDVLRRKLVGPAGELAKELANSLERVAEILNNLKWPSIPLEPLKKEKDGPQWTIEV